MLRSGVNARCSIKHLEEKWREETRLKAGEPAKKFCWSGFQLGADELHRRALLLAACGAGKTLAAWRWIESTLAKEKKAGREYGRVLFLYPTRGTATEGFRDYVSWAPEADASLAHGTAAYDLAEMFANQTTSDERKQKSFISDADARLFALAQWPKRVFSATVDAFLGVMANQYGPMCLLPVLADSIIVIDEVHSFSASMFSALRCFLQRFDAPVLCMTASLPTDRRDTLVEAGLELFPREPKQFDDLRLSSGHPRYRFYASSRIDAERIALEKLGEGKRVLWVVNRVDECRGVYEQMYKSVNDDPDLEGLPVFCYHSRFRLVDRRSRHNDVVEEFQRTDRRAALAVTTQVCEMSLDLDADVLISEVAPVTSLIQRAGRCCRQQHPGTRFGEIFLYEPAQDLPYEQKDVAEGRVFRDTLVHMTTSSDSDGGAVSQDDLSDKLRELDPEVEALQLTAQSFWNSGFWAHPTDFRESEETTIECVLESDVGAYLASKKQRRPEAPGFVVPVPRKAIPLLKQDPRLKPLLIAPYEFYCPLSGYGLREEESNG